jgi:hypothetical protein
VNLEVLAIVRLERLDEEPRCRVIMEVSRLRLNARVIFASKPFW